MLFYFSQYFTVSTEIFFHCKLLYFSGVETLEYLVLSDNDLTNIPVNVFGNLVNLKWLLLDNNLIFTIHVDWDDPPDYPFPGKRHYW